ncbi:hypothetical protein B0H10DRAFT_2189507 [Mycena sp. CBHHK59/15]|nr:hypothetical protein B0H10DRAFT_2189507 [Mycena sp. CBHHK59/15]
MSWLKRLKLSGTPTWVPTRSIRRSSEPPLTPKAISFTKNLTALRLSPVSSPKLDLKARGLGWLHITRNPPPAYKLPMTDASSKSHRMVLALCNGLAACDTIRGGDETHEADNNERFDVTEWIIGEEDARAEDMVLLVPYSSAKQESSPSFRTPRKRISKVGPAANPDDLPHSMDEVDTAGLKPTSSSNAELVQRDYMDKEGKLIAPEELYATLTEGTLVLVMVSLATYVLKDQKTEKGDPLPDKKIYHMLVDRLKVLDRGDAAPWNPPVPAVPEARLYSPMASPQRRGRNDAADTAFNAFRSKSSPSPAKRRRGN